MITTGIIKEINLNSKNIFGNKYLVEIPLFKKPGYNSPETYIMRANASCFSGSYGEFEPGDFVYVSFINNEVSFPVILGKIYKGNEEKFRGNLKINNLNVANSVNISENFKIGNMDWSQVKEAVKKVNLDNNKIFHHHIGIKLTSGNTCYLNLYSRNANSYKGDNSADNFTEIKNFLYNLNGNDPQSCTIKINDNWISGLIFCDNNNIYCSYSGISGTDTAINILSDKVFILD